MPRANKHFIPGNVWHITHRCHKQEFLLKFSRDRRRWIYWLFEAKKRYGLCVFNYCVTSNHIHLLVQDTAADVMPKSMQLIAGRTAQEYNLRKQRKGAFWEDRYHATAVEADEHLIRCLVYIDLNMVRAGVVDHASQWFACGYQEIQNPPKRYRIIDQQALAELCGIKNSDELRDAQRQWIDSSLGKQAKQRDPSWSKSIAVGSKSFVEETKTILGIGFLKRKIISTDEEQFSLRETLVPYNSDFDIKNRALSLKNTFLWNNN